MDAPCILCVSVSQPTVDIGDSGVIRLGVGVEERGEMYIAASHLSQDPGVQPPVEVGNSRVISPVVIITGENAFRREHETHGVAVLANGKALVGGRREAAGKRRHAAVYRHVFKITDSVNVQPACAIYAGTDRRHHHIIKT